MGDAPSGDNNPDPSGNGNPPAPTNPNPGDNSGGDFDITKIPRDQLEKVLEHPEFMKLGRVKQLADDSKAYKKLQEDQAKANDEKLKTDKKWEDLATNKETENTSLKEQIKNMNINQALTNKLVPEGVIDIEAAIKIADTSKIEVAEDGTVTGVDEVVAALKADKAYMFGKPGQPTMGQPTSPQNEPSGPSKFKRSQLRDPTFYAANRKEILEASKAGHIEDDLTGSPK